MDRGLYNLVVVLDLKKAFDTVNHGILLSKHQMYGFNSKAINLMRSYLTHRTHTYQLTNVYSDERDRAVARASIGGVYSYIQVVSD